MWVLNVTKRCTETTEMSDFWSLPCLLTFLLRFLSHLQPGACKGKVSVNICQLGQSGRKRNVTFAAVWIFSHVRWDSASSGPRINLYLDLSRNESFSGETERLAGPSSRTETGDSPCCIQTIAALSVNHRAFLFHHNSLLMCSNWLFT